MQPKATKQKTKHSRHGDRREIKTHHGGQDRSAKITQSQPPKPECPCCMSGQPVPGNEPFKHSFGRHHESPTTSSTSYLSLRISELRALVANKQFELESACARRWLTTKLRFQAIAEQTRLEKERKAAEVRVRRQASIRNAAFVTLRYGRTVEERKRVGLWSAHQIVLPFSDLPQTNTVTPSAPSFTDSNVLDPAIVPSVNVDTAPILSRFHGNVEVAHRTLSNPFHTAAISVKRPPSPPHSVTSDTYDIRKLSIQTPNSESPTPTDTGTMSNQQARDLTGGVDASIKDLIQQLFFLQQHISQFRNDKQSGLISQAEQVAHSIGRLQDQISRPENPLHNVSIAPDIIDYVEDGRNPDIFTRDFVELVQRGNSVLNGKQKAFKDFSKIYAKALKDNFDGLDEEVDMIMADAGLVEKNGKFVEKGLQNGNSN